MRGHADALVEARGARWRVRVDVQVAASLATLEQCAEDVPHQRRGDRSAAVGTARAERRNAASRRILLRLRPSEQVPGDERAVPREERELTVELRRLDEPVPELVERLLRLAPVVDEGLVVRVERGDDVNSGSSCSMRMPVGALGAGESPTWVPRRLSTRVGRVRATGSCVAPSGTPVPSRGAAMRSSRGDLPSRPGGSGRAAAPGIPLIPGALEDELASLGRAER